MGSGEGEVERGGWLGRVHQGGEAVGGRRGGVVGGGGSGGGRLDDGVIGVIEGGGPVNGVGLVSFEADLASKGLGTLLNTWVVGESAEECVVGGGEVLENGETGADSVRAEVSERREGILLVLKDKASNEFGVEFDYHWRGGRWFLGGYGKGTGEGEMKGGGVLGRGGRSPLSLAASKMGVKISLWTM
jgi:hypothetical protein